MTFVKEKVDSAKQAAAEKAAGLIESGMLVGLGTGSTATFFISALANRCRNGLKILCIATSNQSAEQAKREGLSLYSIDEIESIDITVDGVDEIDPKKRMIKGAGGALVREKIIASSSTEMVVIADETKLVENLGRTPLPIEIIPFACNATIYKLKKLGYFGQLRTKGHSFYVTDNGNYIYDLLLETPIADVEELNAQILAIPGVVDTGFFFNLAGRIVVGYFNGTTKIIE